MLKGVPTEIAVHFYSVLSFLWVGPMTTWYQNLSPSMSKALISPTIADPLLACPSQSFFSHQIPTRDGGNIRPDFPTPL